MKSVSIKQAREQFAKLVESARRGTPVTITRRGRKVAQLKGMETQTSGQLPDLTAFRASLKSGRTGKNTTIEDLRASERA